MNGPIINEFHCPIISCNQLDFLPFDCKYCQIKFCLNHRNPETHKCQGIQKKHNPNLNTHINPKLSKKCANLNCHSKLSPINEYECKKCGNLVCLKHRFEETHECINTMKIQNTENLKQEINKKNESNEIIKKATQKPKRNQFFFCFWNCGKNKK